MKILTLGPSPYLKTSIGRLHSEIIMNLKKFEDVEVSACAWHINQMWLMPDEENRFFYETDEGEIICRLYPTSLNVKQGTPAAYEAIKDYKPDIVLTIGNYHQTDFVYAIKQLNPDLFKWVSLIALDCGPIYEPRLEAFDYIDDIIVLSKFAQEEILKKTGKTSKILSWGPSDIFRNSKLNESNDKNLNILMSTKNSNSTNLAAFLEALSYLKRDGFEFNSFLHINKDDPGDYDLNLLIKRFGLEKEIKMAEGYRSVHDGLSDEGMRDLYLKYDVIVDCSVRSGTGIGTLEAMACGCYPIVSEAGKLKEIAYELSKYKDTYEKIETISFIGSMLEQYKIVAPMELYKILKNWIYRKEGDLFKLLEKKKRCKKIANTFYDSLFFEKIKDILIEVRNRDRQINVEEIK
jgi:glycosyltransferase involved in cell wall biosynthesis